MPANYAYLTPRQVAKRINFHVNTIRRYCSEGLFPKAIIIAGRWKIPEDSLEHFLAQYQDGMKNRHNNPQ